MPKLESSLPNEVREVAAPDPARARHFDPRSAIRNLQSTGLVLVLLLLSVALTFASPYFLTSRNLLNVLLQTSINTVLAVGMTFVIISGGIDLSVGSALALTAVVMAALAEQGVSVPLVMTAGLLCGAGTGAANGLAIVRMKIPAFIVTLGTLSIARGLALVVAGGRTITVEPYALRMWGEGRLLGVPIPTVFALVLVIIGHVTLTRTVFGRHLLAIGANEKVAWLAGVSTGLTRWMAYIISGVMVFLGALISTGRLGSADPIRGEGYELDAIAAVIIGGTSLKGGRGSVFGTLLGALLIGVMRNGLTLRDVTDAWQKVIIGAVIVTAVFLDRLRNKASGE